MFKTKLKIVFIIAVLILPLKCFAITFTWPLKNWHFDLVEQQFGTKRAPGIYHFGDDVAANAKTPVHAIAEGIVKNVGIYTNFGTVILIEHTLSNSEQVVSLYGHLSMRKLKVRPEQFVNKNEIIGYIGTPEENGGWPEHLHFGIRSGPYVDATQKWVYWGLGSKKELKNWYNPTEFIQTHLNASYEKLSQGKIITSPAQNYVSKIKLFNPNQKSLKSFNFQAFSDKYKNGCQIALADIDADENKELIISQNNTKNPTVKIFNITTQELITKFKPFDKNYQGQINLAAGDIDGDQAEEIIIATGPNYLPQIKIFHYNTLTSKIENYNFNNLTIEQFNNLTIQQFNKKSGLNIATIDINQDDKKEILATPASKTKSILKYFDGQNWITLINNIYEKNFKGGAKIATGDLNGDGIEEIITGSGQGREAKIKIFNITGKEKKLKFYPFSKTYKDGINVATTDFDNDNVDEIITATANKSQSWIKIYKYQKGRPILAEFKAYSKNFFGGVNIIGIR